MRMKRVLKSQLILTFMAIMCIGFTTCCKDKNDEEVIPYVLANGMDATTLNFGPKSGVSYKQSVKVTSNEGWSITGIPEWLSVSPTNGNGEISIEIYPKTDNDTDDKERKATLTIQGSNANATINVFQETDLDVNAYVNPTNLVCLYNGIAFDFTLGKSVSYYYRGYIEKNAVATMTDSEIINVLEENFNRYTASDNEVAVFSGLDEGKDYIICTIGYNSSGKHGKLKKTEASTKRLQTNEPMAWISDPTYDESNWYWDVEKSATCNTYYMITTEDADFALDADVYQAWMINYYIRNNWTSEYVNGGSWYSSKTGLLIAVMTWGVDRRDNFAGTIDWNMGIDNSIYDTYMPMQTSANIKSDVIDKNYPILEKNKLTIDKMK